MIHFRSHGTQEPLCFSPIDPSKLERLDWRQRQLGVRFDDLAHMLDLPHGWAPARRDIGVLILLSQDALDLEIVESIWTSYEQGAHGWRGAGDMDVDLLHRLEQAIGRCEGNLTEDMCNGDEALWAELDRTIRDLNRAWRGLDPSTRESGLPGGCPGLEFNGLSILGDAFFIGLANWVGYLLGTAAQTGMERYICGGKELSYGHRVGAELVNRFIQHLVRFAIRDVLIPLVKHKGGLKSLTPQGCQQGWWQFLIAAVCLTAADLGGVEIMKKLPTVRKQEDGLPDAWDNGLQMSVFAGTDMVGWMLIGAFSQLLLKVKYEQVKEPLEGVGVKALTHFCQVVVDGLVVSGWKNAHQTLNPNSQCLPGVGDGLLERSPEYAGFVFALDGGELAVKAVTDLMWEVKRQCRKEAPRNEVGQHRFPGLGTGEDRGLLARQKCLEIAKQHYYERCRARSQPADPLPDDELVITGITARSFTVQIRGEAWQLTKLDGRWIAD